MPDISPLELLTAASWILTIYLIIYVLTEGGDEP